MPSQGGTGKPHLERWLERMVTRADQLAEIGAVAGVGMDGETAHCVAAWAYSSAQVAGGHAWLSTSRYEQVDNDYLRLLSS